MWRRGAWLQFGAASQKVAIEHLTAGFGVGVVLSPRDLALHNAVSYAEQYTKLGAQVLVDPQFYHPNYTNAKTESYEFAALRTTVSTLGALDREQLRSLSKALVATNRDLASSGVISPAVLLEAGQPARVSLNARMVDAARDAAQVLSKPVIATIALSHSMLSSRDETSRALAAATSVPVDGWYLAAEFDGRRIVESADLVRAFGDACLTLACTGKPVLHGYAGPLALLSLGFGATGAAVGHSQNLWHFTPERFGPPQPGGGGGNAPPRYFSGTLWGTVIHPDETATLGPLLGHVLTPTRFSNALQAGSNMSLIKWPRWEAGKHLVATICSTVDGIAAACGSARLAADTAVVHLEHAIMLHQQIARSGCRMRSESSPTYHAAWITAARGLRTQRDLDYSYLEALSSL